MKRVWKTPPLDYYNLYADMLRQPHLLIAGATGSGKSVVINGILTTALKDSPSRVQFVLIDPKRVELINYAPLPHTIRYSTEPGDMVQALQDTLKLTDQRYKDMARHRVKQYAGGAVYVVIDELADLMTTDRKHIQAPLQRLCQIGRAANVHVIAATQCPLSSVIPTPIKVNFDSRVALRTRSTQDSRNILGVTGCELLPRYGKGFYMRPEGCELYDIPMYPTETTQALIRYWQKQKPHFIFFLDNLKAPAQYRGFSYTLFLQHTPTTSQNAFYVVLSYSLIKLYTHCIKYAVCFK